MKKIILIFVIVIALWVIALSCARNVIDKKTIKTSPVCNDCEKSLTLYSGSGSVINQWDGIHVRRLTEGGFVSFKDKDGHILIVSGTVVVK